MAEVILPHVNDACLGDATGLHRQQAPSTSRVAQRALNTQRDALVAVLKALVHPNSSGVVAQVVHHEVHPTILVKVGSCHHVGIQVIDGVDVFFKRGERHRVVSRFFRQTIAVEVVDAVGSEEVVLGHKQVQVGVVVGVHPSRAPTKTIHVQAVKGRLFIEMAAWLPHEELGPEAVTAKMGVGVEDVLQPVLVEISQARRHAIHDQVEAQLMGYVQEGSVSLIPEKGVGAGFVVDHVDVGKSIFVLIPPKALEAQPNVVARPRANADVGEGQVAVVAKQHVAVLGVAFRR